MNHHSSSSELIVESLNLRREYDDLVAVNDLSLTLSKGAVLALVGPNGSGKTTWLRMIAGLLEPTRGTAKIAGVDVRLFPREVHRLVGFLPDFYGMYHDLTVEEYLSYFARAYGLPRTEIPSRVTQILERVSLQEKRKEKLTSLSRGMKQRAAIGRTLVNDPPLLLLDEPAAGLDPEARNELQVLFQRLASEGKTLIVSSHILTELEEYSTHVAMLQKGNLMAFGRVEDVRSAAVASRRLRIHALNSEEARKGYELIRSKEMIESVEVKDHEIFFAFKGNEEAQAELLKEIILKEIQIVSLSELQGSIQDAYLSIMKGTSE